MGISFMIPSNFTACISIMFTADLAVFFYRFYLRALISGSGAN
jgi:hypothetical protein